MKGWVGPAIVSTAVDAVGVLPVFLTGALAVQLNRDIGLDAGALGLVYASYFAAAALLSAPLRRLSERTGPESALRVGTLGSVVALLGIALFARSPAGLAVGVSEGQG